MVPRTRGNQTWVARLLLKPFGVLITYRDPLFDAFNFFKHRVDVGSLAFERSAAFGKFAKYVLGLAGLTLRCIVQVQNFGNFTYREAQTLAAQDKFEPYPVAFVVHTCLAVALRGYQALGFVITYGAWGNIELTREVAYPVRRSWCSCRGRGCNHMQNSSSVPVVMCRCTPGHSGLSSLSLVGYALGHPNARVCPQQGIALNSTDSWARTLPVSQGKRILPCGVAEDEFGAELIVPPRGLELSRHGVLFRMHPG
jgi:hypothetical protein